MGCKCQSKFYFSSLTHFSSRNHTDLFPLRIGPNQPNPPQQDSPVPSLPHEQTLQQLTPGPSGTQWSEDLFHGKQPKFHLISTFDSSDLTVPPFVEPPKWMSHLFLARVHPSNHMRTFQLMSMNLRWLQHNPWRNLLVSPKFTFFTLPNFSSPFLSPSPACPTPPHSIIIIDNTPVRSLPNAPTTPPPPPIIPMMRLARNLLTYNQP
ncbi:hypothetical protein O181_024181 [Austropuccinia psidii MF-1]|uniref:Uncharacterized protein n=1 Tax=Austropuccinia psidii MF-1 TaxID=1389203 RepID=A0A9Q3GYD3_9BASI|nr:hypothetical protein [Austropuccinia psidii MF-1]